MTPALLRDFPTYAKHALKIKRRAGGALIPFRLNPMQVVVDEAIMAARRAGRPPRIVILKPRKLGCSTGIAGRYTFETATQRYQKALVVAHKGDAATDIFGIYERFYNNLPTIAGLNLRPRRIGARGQEIYYPDMDCRLTVASANAGITARGGESQFVHLSEWGFIEDGEEKMSEIMPNVPTTPESCVVVETTSPGKDTWFYRFWSNEDDTTAVWTRIFRPWMIEPDFAMSPGVPEAQWTDEERSYIEELHLTPEQLAWRRFIIQTQFIGSVVRFRIEYPMSESECWTQLGKTLWDYDDIEALYQRRAPIFTGELTAHGLKKDPNGGLLMYEAPQPGAMYVIGADPAGGFADGDLSVACVWKVTRDGRHWPEQVAEWAGHEGPIGFASILKTLGYYYNRALLSVEVTGVGKGCQDALMRVCHYPFLHRWVKWDRFSTRSQTYGWETTHSSKQAMLGVIDWLVRTHRLTIRSENLFREWLGMRQVGDAHQMELVRFMGLEGDDRFMAACIGLVSWFQHLFGGTKLMDLQMVLSKAYGNEGQTTHQEPVAVGADDIPTTVRESGYIPPRRKREVNDEW